MRNLRLWHEFLPYDKVERKISIFKKYDVEPSIAVARSKISKFKRLAERLNEKDVSSYLWPVLEGEGYFVNSRTVKKFVSYMEKLKPMLKEYSTIKTVVFDMEDAPVINSLYDSKMAKALLENATKRIQKDYGKDVLTVQNFFALNKLWNLPTPRNANRSSIMTYTSFLFGKLSSKWRKFLIKRVVESGRKNYGEVEIDLGAASKGILPQIFRPLTYKDPKNLKEEIEFLKENRVDSVGVYGLDGMKDVELWLKELTDVL